MDDLISRQAAIHYLMINMAWFDEDGRMIDDWDEKKPIITDLIAGVPSAQPERKNGQWIGKPIAGYCTVRCSVCNDVFLENSGKWNFCPNCGADNRGEQECR